MINNKILFHLVLNEIKDKKPTNEILNERIQIVN